MKLCEWVCYYYVNLSTHLFNALVLSYAIIVVQYYNHHHDIGKSFEFQQIVGEF